MLSATVGALSMASHSTVRETKQRKGNRLRIRAKAKTPRQGFEPQFSGPEPDVLPLHHPGITYILYSFLVILSRGNCIFAERLLGYDNAMKKSKRFVVHPCEPIELTSSQLDQLTALRAAQEESDREERFVFLRQQEDDAETLRVIQSLLVSSGLKEGKTLKRDEMTRLLTLVRALAPNPNLDARILRQPREPEALSQDLTQLLFSNDSPYRRLTDFLSRRHIGGQTAFQFLAATYPDMYPLISSAASRLLDISPEQSDEAVAMTRRCFQIEPDVPNTDQIVRLLANIPVYLAAKLALDCPDFITAHRLLTQKIRGRNASRKLSTQLYTPQSNRIAEPKSAYLILPDQQNASPVAPQSSLSKETVLRAIENEIAEAGFTYPPLLIRSAFLSLQSKPLLWLLGRNGVGKTRLTHLIANAITGNPVQYLLLPVRPDWHDSTPLLGYVNVLAGQYVRTPFLDFLIEAAQPANIDNAYFLCLDEMNLARIEHYCAEVLSAIETPNRTLTLPNGQTIDIPYNLSIMGTLNSDEATVSLSRRVLDRANTLTLNTVHLGDIPQATGENKNSPIPYSDRQRAFLSTRVGTIPEARAKMDSIQPNLTQNVIETLVTLNGILELAELGFAYRVRDEILLFCANAFDHDGSGLLCHETPKDFTLNLNLALDFQIVQKILPRISGTTDQLTGVLDTFQTYATTCGLKQTSAQITRLQTRLSRYGFVRFDEI